MCGIAGAVWSDQGRPLERDTLRRMTDALRHRGPDDQGEYRSEFRTDLGHRPTPGAALGFRRLAIIDLATGNQPLANEDESVWLVFNGEVYNYVDLRRRLQGSGHRFRTQGDAETIVHLYEDEGLGFVRHLRGMFALALWDANQGQLVLARDRLGKKPLVYRQEPGRLLFASELKALLAVPDVPRQLDAAALDAYLTYQYVPHPATIFRGLHKLPPASLGVYRDGRLRIEGYWTPDFAAESRRPAAELREQLRHDLTEAVRLRLQSDVPLGAFLSGGIDSSIVVALAQQASGERVKTFSIGFAVPEFDETSYAREVAARLGTEHHEFRVEPSAVEVLPKLVWHYDEPFADSSAIPTYYVARHTRQHVTVALTGDGGDELFAGYERYRAVQLAEWFDRLPRGLRRAVAGEYWQRLPQGGRQRSPWRRARRLMSALARPPGRRYLDWIGIFDERRRAALYTDEFLASLPDADPYRFLAEALAQTGARDVVTAASLADLITYLPCDLMTKVDIASMANSLECRAPLLDHHVVETAIAMPSRMKLRRGRGKRVLLETFGDLLPRSVRRRGKMGFGVPLAHWFRGELGRQARDTLLDPAAVARGYFRPEEVRRLLDEHASGRWDHGYRLWALLFFEMWHRQWIDGAR
jgi:asparagine synthase (glutamine-hydrolysing)